MATLDANRLNISRWMVNNQLTTGNIFQEGKGKPRAISTKQDVVDVFGEIIPQFGKARQGNTFPTIHMSGDAVRPEDPGTGGPLLGLLEKLAKSNPQAAREAATELDHYGRLTTESGASYQIGKSGCSNSDISDFSARRGLWAGFQA